MNPNLSNAVTPTTSKTVPRSLAKMNLAVDGYKSDYLYINTQTSDYDLDKLVDCFTGLQRMKCKREGRDLSPFAAWNNKEYMTLVIEQYMEKRKISQASI